MVKRTLYLPVIASTHYVYESASGGAIAIPVAAELYDICLIVSAFQLLTTPDQSLWDFPLSDAYELASTRLVWEVTRSELEVYFSGDRRSSTQFLTPTGAACGPRPCNYDDVPLPVHTSSLLTRLTVQYVMSEEAGLANEREDLNIPRSKDAHYQATLADEGKTLNIFFPIPHCFTCPIDLWQHLLQLRREDAAVQLPAKAPRTVTLRSSQSSNSKTSTGPTSSKTGPTLSTTPDSPTPPELALTPFSSLLGDLQEIPDNVSATMGTPSPTPSEASTARSKSSCASLFSQDGNVASIPPSPRQHESLHSDADHGSPRRSRPPSPAPALPLS
ncbi:hypothetical protein HPB51_026312 [Rhipicephalus microplus]|uniref:Uncharacterized protein n=1 Tax=Rhipicephalus microplus TaxID=6941 RepID=A0A9J6D3D9_RHIMP|nr:hypothetical protein HPB51_026312 [Rhipicephalus microplus]